MLGSDLKLISFALNHWTIDDRVQFVFLGDIEEAFWSTKRDDGAKNMILVRLRVHHHIVMGIVNNFTNLNGLIFVYSYAAKIVRRWVYYHWEGGKAAGPSNQGQSAHHHHQRLHQGSQKWSSKLFSSRSWSSKLEASWLGSSKSGPLNVGPSNSGPSIAQNNYFSGGNFQAGVVFMHDFGFE